MNLDMDIRVLNPHMLSTEMALSVCVAMGDEQNSVDKYILSIDSEMETSASGFMPISKINKKKVPKDLGSFIVSLQQCNQAQEDTINPYFIRTEWKSFRSYKAQPLAPPVPQTLVEPISQRTRPRRPGIRAGPDHKARIRVYKPALVPQLKRPTRTKCTVLRLASP